MRLKPEKKSIEIIIKNETKLFMKYFDSLSLETDNSHSQKLDTTQVAKAFGSTSTRHRSDNFLLDRCLIDVDPRVCATREVIDLPIFNEAKYYAVMYRDYLLKRFSV